MGKEGKMKILYSFWVDTETNEVMTAGTITAMEAAGIMQQLAIAEAVQKAKSDNGNKEVEEYAVTGLPQQGES